MHCTYEENLFAENMKDYFIYVSRIITDVVTTKCKNPLLFVKDRIRICSFVSLLMLQKFKFYVFQKLACGRSLYMTLYNMSLFRIGNESIKHTK